MNGPWEHFVSKSGDDTATAVAAPPAPDGKPWQAFKHSASKTPAPAASVEPGPWSTFAPATPGANESPGNADARKVAAKVPASGSPSERPGFGKVFKDAVNRGAASAVASTAHTIADTIDQTVQGPVRHSLGTLFGKGPAAEAFADPLGARDAAESTLAVEKEINTDRQAASERIGARPTLAEAKDDPVDAAKRYALRLTNAAGESAPLLAAAIATRNPEIGTALMGGATGAQSYTDLRSEGIDRFTAAQAGLLTGAIEAAGEGIALPKVLAATGTRSLRRAALAEGLQEGPVQIAQQQVEDQATGRETPVADQLLDAVDASLVGGALGAGAHVASNPRGVATSSRAPQPTQVPPGNGLPGDAVRAQAAEVSKTGPLGRAASVVLQDQAEQIDQQAVATGEVQQAPPSPRPWEAFQTADTAPSKPAEPEPAIRSQTNPQINPAELASDGNVGPSPVQVAAMQAATSPANDLPQPTPAQVDSGNFRVGRTRVNGLDISIEHPAGVKRKPEHDQVLTHPYGYIRRTEGADGENVDVFLGPHATDTSRPVFVIDQHKPDGSFDEHKAMLGFKSAEEARAEYLSNYPKGWNGVGAIRQFTQDGFKTWVQDPKATKKPAAGTGIALDHAQRLTQRFTRGWGPDAPRVVLARDAEELRTAAGLPADAQVGERAEGSWQGQPAVFLNVGAIDSPQRFQQVLAHEALGHYGIDRIVGKDWTRIESTIADHIRNDTGAKDVRAAIDQVRRSQPEALANPQTAAREVLAVMAEKGSRGGLIDRVVSGARAFLRKAMPGMSLSNAEMRDLVRQGDSFLRRGADPGTPFPPATIADLPPGHPAALFSKVAEPAAVEAPDLSQVAPAFAHLDEAQRATLGKIDTFRGREGVGEKLSRLTARWQEKAVQGAFDQFAPLKALDETAYQQARLSKGTDGAVEAAFQYGPPKLTDGALDVQRDGKGLRGVLQDLGGEHDLFLAWVAGNRAERLATEDREHLFSPDEIANLKRLSVGKMADGRVRSKVYGRAQRALMRYQKAVLDVAEQAGILDAEHREQWEHEFYVPFYRVMEGDKAVSPGAVGGLVRQQAFDRLKGGAEPLGDLLQNTMANWSHLLSASMKNLAATRALDAAVDLGIATPAKAADKGTVWAMKDGSQVHYTVNDPLVFDALSMMHHPGWDNPAMKAMRFFKRALTAGVTADPAFRIRNLIRDTLSAVAANPVSYNPMRNLVSGWKASSPGSDTYLKLLGGGGAIRFGSMLDGDQAAHAKRLIQSGIATKGQILDTPAKAKAAFSRAWEWWKEVGDRAETVNRAAIYEHAIATGKNHLEASYAARDALDFTMQGKWAAVRFLTQTVPFLNARLQGVHKLGRAAKTDPRRFTAVTGVVAMASALLYLANKDDDEFKALPDWVRDTYWWVRLPGTDHAMFLPKPFEIGALGSVVERGTELMLAGNDYSARDFGQTLLNILSGQLSMNPVPQIFRPLMEASFNWNTFQGRPIDGTGQERLPAEDRHTARTSAGAIALGRVVKVSPQRIEHMVRGYFGWLGTQALAVSDLIGRELFDMPANPAHDFSRPENLAIVGAFIRPASGSGSKYVNRYYNQLGQVQQLYAAWKAARMAGDYDRAAALYKDDRIRLRGLYTAADKHMRAVNQRIRRVTADRSLSARSKAELLAGLYRVRDRLAERTTERARDRESRQGTQR